MVEGLKLIVPGSEVRDLLLRQHDQYICRAVKAQKAVELLGADADHGMASKMNFAHDQAESFQSRAAEFKFMADHTDISESFLLDRHDLTILGVCSTPF